MSTAVDPAPLGPGPLEPDLLAAPSIRTYHDPKPIPCRDFDWEAVTDSYEGGDPIGFGATEDEALRDLREQLEDETP